MENTVIPMQTVKNFAGSYTVLGTSRECIVEQAGIDLAMWRLKVDGEHHSFHATKRDALVLCQEHPEL